VEESGQGGQSEVLTPPQVLASTGWQPSRKHLRRLRALWRSAGWPSHDAIELDLLSAGLIEPVGLSSRLTGALECLRPTAQGLAWLKHSLEHNRGTLSAHEALVRRVVETRSLEGRIVWTGISLRAPLDGGHDNNSDAAMPPLGGRLEPGASDRAVSDLFGESVQTPASRSRWRLCRPDVFSIRNTTQPQRLAPRIDEIKVRRADLNADLKCGDKREAYLSIAGECWYVLGADRCGRPIADPSEIPEPYGVMVEEGSLLRMARPALRQGPPELGFQIWMALARAAPHAPPEGMDPVQADLDAG
jgi:hypothetical protein